MVAAGKAIQPMIRFGQDEGQPGHNGLPYTQALSPPMRDNDGIDNLGHPHLLLLPDQQRNIINSFVLYFYFCHAQKFSRILFLR